ncbi:MAG: pyridoxamine 5'-phosphate oxidase family protein [Pyrinomonadaceae bacterium]
MIDITNEGSLKRNRKTLMSKEFEQTSRTKIRRIPKRGSYKADEIYGILDEALVCHIGFTVDSQTFVIPTAFGRKENILYLHGAVASRMLKEISRGIDICVTVTLVDGLVLARSAFHHSINYRSVVIFGTGLAVTDDAEKTEALKVIMEHLIPNRWQDVRLPNIKELNATSVLKVRIDEASAKIRTGFPVDDLEDYDIDVWAGILPLEIEVQNPLNDERLKPGIAVPSYVKSYRR